MVAQTPAPVVPAPPVASPVPEPPPPPVARTCNTADCTDTGAGFVNVEGTWRITGYVRGPSPSLSDNAAQAMNGRTVTLDDTTYRAPWMTCTPARWTHRETTPTAWLEEWHAPPLTNAQRRALGLDSPDVTVWESTCPMPGAPARLRAVQAEDRTLNVLYEGLWFTLRPL